MILHQHLYFNVRMRGSHYVILLSIRASSCNMYHIASNRDRPPPPKKTKKKNNS